jgi:hypothetical protein
MLLSHLQTQPTEGAMSDPLGQDFVLFVECVFTMKSLVFYRYDLSKLLVILLKTKNEGSEEPWYAQRFDPLTMHCEYLIAKMSCDVRESIHTIPSWLRSLAGHEDKAGDGKCRQIAAFAQICDEIGPLLKKYGPDSHNTLPPPAIT